MKAMLLEKICSLADDQEPLKKVELPDPVPGDSEILIKVSACGVCHTEIDEIEGRTPPAEYPVVPGHQIVGKIIDKGTNVKKREVGERVGVAWIYSVCGNCQFCMSNQENLCPEFKATGRDVNGGYAELIAVPESFVYNIPDVFSDLQAAPLLCAGAIGYRSLFLGS
jgi:propanol-preferring alcohol dehydrogenase